MQRIWILKYNPNLIIENPILEKPDPIGNPTNLKFLEQREIRNKIRRLKSIEKKKKKESSEKSEKKKKKTIHNNRNLNTQQWSGVFDKRRTFNRLEDAWAVVWEGGERGSKHEGGWNRAPISEGERLWEVVQVGGCGTRSPRGVHPLRATSALDTLTPVCVCGGVRTPKPRLSATCSLPCTAAAVSTGEGCCCCCCSPLSTRFYRRPVIWSLV